MSATRSPRARAASTLVVALVVGLLAGCGISKDSHPRVIAGEKVPFGLLGPSTTTQGGTAQDGTVVQVYFVAGQRLQAVERTVGDTEPRTVLDTLLKGVTSNDPSGLSTAIPLNTTITDTALNRGTLTITLSKDIVNVTGTEQTKAFAQLTYTAFSSPGISGVQFRALDDSGQAQDLEPITDTGSKQGPVTRSDFNALAPSP